MYAGANGACLSEDTHSAIFNAAVSTSSSVKSSALENWPLSAVGEGTDTLSAGPHIRGSISSEH
jgi:hypothetical protein